MNARDITVLVLTFNEAPNIGRSLAALAAFDDVVVLDSGSTDETASIAASHPNVRFITRPFDNHAAQWNHGLGHCTREWVLALDADYFLPEGCVREIETLEPSAEVAGFRAAFLYRVGGRLLRGSLYPPVTVLFRRARAAYEQDGHTQKIRVDGAVRELRSPIIHDDRKPLSRWLSSQLAYAQLEAGVLHASSWRQLRLQDKLRRMIFVAPWLVPLYCLIVRGGILDGWAGVYYAAQRGIAEAIIALKLVERHLEKGGTP